MKQDFIKSDKIIFTPDQVDLRQSPLAGKVGMETYVLGAFNPGLCRLPNGNLLMMVRVAEALVNPQKDDNVYSLRWDKTDGYVTTPWPMNSVSMEDPRKFRILDYASPVYALTSLSWLLPVELDAGDDSVVKIHYDKIIAPQIEEQEFGIEDPRISTIGGRYYMTVCCVGSGRLSTMLYYSEDGLNYHCRGIILDHQNKDMLIFEGKINDNYYALTRPLGECYFASSPDSEYYAGPCIQMASSPDAVHWKPKDQCFFRARRGTLANERIGAGTPPILTSKGWLFLYHGVQHNGGAGIYRTFYAILNKEQPEDIIHVRDRVPLLESNPQLTVSFADKVYLKDIVFTTGIATAGNEFVVASGELDLACRITHISDEILNY